MDADFGALRDKKISEGLKQWDEWDKMICDHVDPGPLGTSLDYMESHDIFKLIKASKYNLYHFYQVGLTGDIPEFPEPREPTTSNHVHGLLKKAQVLSQPNLLVAHLQDEVTAVCLLRELHTHISL